MTYKRTKGIGDRETLEKLLIYPSESLSVEYKGWLDLSCKKSSDSANLAKAIIAIANHGGGYVVIGFQEHKNSVPRWKPDLDRPENLKGYSVDEVNDLVKYYAEPDIDCEFDWIQHPENESVFPVLYIRGGLRFPVRCKRDHHNNGVRINTYYIRRSGPSSDSPQTGAEWDELINRCVTNAREELLDRIRTIIDGPLAFSDENIQKNNEEQLLEWMNRGRERFNELIQKELSEEDPDRYEKGLWMAGYSILGEFEKPELGNLSNRLKNIEGNVTGWPVWWVPQPGLHILKGPYPYENVVECWMKDTKKKDGAHSDFWRVSPEGLAYIVRGYREDSSPNKTNPGETLWIQTPIVIIGECLLHAKRFAGELKVQEATIRFKIEWHGLMDRRLDDFYSGHGGDNWFKLVDKQCHQNEILSPVVEVTVEAISDNLPEIIEKITKSLYESFDFYEIRMEIIQRELKKLKQGR